MYRLLAAGMAALGVLAGPPLQAQTPSDVEALDELETVLVIGEQPGPGLWKVSKGEHVMWVLGTYGPLPKGMVWQSQKVEAHIAESQEVLYPGNARVEIDISILRALTLIPAALKASKIPDDKTLKDVLAAETYEKWRALRDKYMGRDDSVERSRPTNAMRQLRNGAYQKHRLSGGPAIGEIVRGAAKKNKVRVHVLPDVERTVKLDDLKGLIKRASKVDVPDVECFTTSLDRVETDIEHMKVRANAWARGDVEALRDLHRQPVVGNECGGVLGDALIAGDSADAAKLKKLRADMRWHEEQARVQLAQNWVAAAQSALDKNQNTFAVLPIRSVVSATGYLAKLKALGYEVEEP